MTENCVDIVWTTIERRRRHSMDHHRASTSGSEQMPAPAPMFRPQKPQQLTQHIYQLYRPENGEPTMEILFFHGLQFGHSPDPPYLSTWRTNDTSKEVWPGTWLPELFPQAHTFTISYDANTKVTREHGRLDVHNLAENLVQDISSVGIGQGVCGLVIFVGHCFGGLVIKELLVQADQPHHSRGQDSKKNQQIEKFLKNIGGVFFYGTPHHGSHLFDKAAYFLDGPLLHYVKSLSKDPVRLEQRFVSVRDKYNIQYIASVGESHETSWGLGGLYSALVVPEGSARYPLGDYYTVAADHFSLCKPANKSSSSFQRLVEFIKSTPSKVQGEACLEEIRPRVPEVAVGLDLRVENVREKLKGMQSVGIVGMGGIGKTILARALLNKLGPQYEYTCFVSVVKAIKGEVEDVKKEMWKQMQHGGRNVANPESNKEDWSQLNGKKLLLVLDDVDSDRDLDGWIDIVKKVASTSRFVVTSRDKELLKNMDHLYAVPFLNETDAKQLFINYAFPSQLAPPLSLKGCVDSIVQKCDGLPLTLEVLGKYLKGKENCDLWEQTLQALDTADNVVGLDQKLWGKLKLSYLSLQDQERQMFLDATTFFSVGDWTLREAKAAWSVNYKLEHVRWKTLVDMSLVYDGEEDMPIKVHEQLQSLGRKLASESKCIRSWEVMEGWNLLQQSVDRTDNQEIRSLRLSTSERYHDDYLRHIGHRQVLKSALSRLQKVQYLDIPNEGKSWSDEGESWSEKWSLRRLLEKTHCKPGTLSFRDVLKEMLPLELVLLRSPTLQLGPLLCKHILLSHLAVLKLDLPPGATDLPGSIGQLSKLKILRIEAQNLTKLPTEIGNLSQLEHLTFHGCCYLTEVPETFGHLSNLKHLVFDDCLELQSLPESFRHLSSLKHLAFQSCMQLQSLPKSFGGLHMLEHLELYWCSTLHTLPDSFGQLCQLKHLSLQRCRRLQTLPESIGRLSHLKYLELFHCPSLNTLPGSFGQWPNLEKLSIRQCYEVRTLPFSPGHLNALRHLLIYGTDLVSIPDWIQTLPMLQILELGYIPKLKGIPRRLAESLPSNVNWRRPELSKFCRKEDGHFCLIEKMDILDTFL